MTKNYARIIQDINETSAVEYLDKEIKMVSEQQKRHAELMARLDAEERRRAWIMLCAGVTAMIAILGSVAVLLWLAA